jgi:hypothetical protein
VAVSNGKAVSTTAKLPYLCRRCNPAALMEATMLKTHDLENLSCFQNHQ